MTTSTFIQGFGLQASLIFALGAQNIFVLESGLRRRRHLLVALVCTLCDAALTLTGVAGAATLFLRFPVLKILFGFLGVAFLAYYGIRKILEKSDTSHSSAAAELPRGARSVILQSVGFSVLNPHALLDTIVLIGGFSLQFERLAERMVFGFGAASFSAVWFFALALSAARMGALFQSARAMRTISIVSGAVLLLLSVKLARDVWEWVG